MTAEGYVGYNLRNYDYVDVSIGSEHRYVSVLQTPNSELRFVTGHQPSRWLVTPLRPGGYPRAAAKSASSAADRLGWTTPLNFYVPSWRCLSLSTRLPSPPSLPVRLGLRGAGG